MIMIIIIIIIIIMIKCLTYKITFDDCFDLARMINESNFYCICA